MAAAILLAAMRRYHRRSHRDGVRRTGMCERGEGMARAKRIGILTGGGDVPGRNSVIKSVTYRATELGFDVYGIRRGWEGLTHQRQGREVDSRYVVHLDRVSTRAID